jgi:hypothetical protein
MQLKEDQKFHPYEDSVVASDIGIEEEADLVEVVRLVEDKTSQYSVVSCLPDRVLEEVAAVFAVSDSSLVAVIGQELLEVEEVWAVVAKEVAASSWSVQKELLVLAAAVVVAVVAAV